MIDIVSIDHPWLGVPAFQVSGNPLADRRYQRVELFGRGRIAVRPVRCVPVALEDRARQGHTVSVVSDGALCAVHCSAGDHGASCRGTPRIDAALYSR